jgi:hypothetical protein
METLVSIAAQRDGDLPPNPHALVEKLLELLVACEPLSFPLLPRIIPDTGAHL